MIKQYYLVNVNYRYVLLLHVRPATIKFNYYHQMLYKATVHTTSSSSRPKSKHNSSNSSSAMEKSTKFKQTCLVFSTDNHLEINHTGPERQKQIQN